MTGIRYGAGWPKLMMRWLTLFTILLIPVAGHCSISIMPMEAKLQVSQPGAQPIQSIEVYNSSDAPIQVVTTVKDWTMNAAGQKQFHEPGTQPLSCANWIQVNPMQFSLPPKKSMHVRYSVMAPANLSQEHSAMIFFTARAFPKAGENRFAVNVQTRMGCKVLVTPIVKTPLKGKIADMELQTIPTSRPIVPGGAPAAVVSSEPLSRIKVAFQNPNPVSIRLSGIVEVYGENGQLVTKSELLPTKAFILSGTTREVWAQFDKPLAPGPYRFKAILDYGVKELMSGELKAQVQPPVIAAHEAAPVQVTPSPNNITAAEQKTTVAD